MLASGIAVYVDIAADEVLTQVNGQKDGWCIGSRFGAADPLESSLSQGQDPYDDIQFEVYLNCTCWQPCHVYLVLLFSCPPSCYPSYLNIKAAIISLQIDLLSFLHRLSAFFLSVLFLPHQLHILFCLLTPQISQFYVPLDEYYVETVLMSPKMSTTSDLPDRQLPIVTSSSYGLRNFLHKFRTTRSASSSAAVDNGDAKFTRWNMGMLNDKETNEVPGKRTSMNSLR